jgi:hypothetical protein
MAKVMEEVLVIKITSLIPDNFDTTALIMDDENIAALQQVVEQFAGNNKRTLVEIEKA